MFRSLSLVNNVSNIYTLYTWKVKQMKVIVSQ